MVHSSCDTQTNPTFFGGCHVTAPSLTHVNELFEVFCTTHSLLFTYHSSVLPPDTTTLFTTSGMQKHKPRFLDPSSTGVISDIQHCLRLTDLDEVGDQTHHLDFHMLGLFSFNTWSVQQGVDFWMDFLTFINVLPDTVTIPPHRPEWRQLYIRYPVSVTIDPECIWSDGVIGGDCTEFYRDGVEIGNIVNPMSIHLDCGFGGERLQTFLSHLHGEPLLPLTRSDVIHQTIRVLLDSGLKPSPNRQGYVLRKLIREQLRSSGFVPDHPFITQERQRLEMIGRNLSTWKRRHPDKPPTFFWETYGVHPDEWEMS